MKPGIDSRAAIARSTLLVRYGEVAVLNACFGVAQGVGLVLLTAVSRNPLNRGGSMSHEPVLGTVAFVVAGPPPQRDIDDLHPFGTRNIAPLANAATISSPAETRGQILVARDRSRRA